MLQDDLLSNSNSLQNVATSNYWRLAHGHHDRPVGSRRSYSGGGSRLEGVGKVNRIGELTVRYSLLY